MAEKTGLPLSQLRLISQGCTLAETGTVQLKAGGAASSREALQNMQHLAYLFDPMIYLQVPSWPSKPEFQYHSILLLTLAQWHWTTVTEKTTKQQYVSSCQGVHHNGRNGMLCSCRLAQDGLPADWRAKLSVHLHTQLLLCRSAPGLCVQAGFLPAA